MLVFQFVESQFPIGIDSDRFIRALENPQVQEHMKELRERFSGRKVMSPFFPDHLLNVLLLKLVFIHEMHLSKRIS